MKIITLGTEIIQIAASIAPSSVKDLNQARKPSMEGVIKLQNQIKSLTIHLKGIRKAVRVSRQRNPSHHMVIRESQKISNQVEDGHQEEIQIEELVDLAPDRCCIQLSLKTKN